MPVKVNNPAKSRYEAQGWLDQKPDIQGVVFLTGIQQYRRYVECLSKTYNEGDRAFCDAIKVCQFAFLVCCFIVSFSLLFFQSTPTLQAAEGSSAVSGTVLETMNASGYTYMNIDTGVNTTWVAIPESAVNKGDNVQYLEGMVMSNFQSKSLNRTFPSIVFSPGLKGQKPFNPHATKAPQATVQEDSFSAAVQKEQGQANAPQKDAVSGGSAGAMVPFSEIAVDKVAGDNGFTVEEIFTKKEELNGQTVRIRGKVVKYNPNIMGKNWIHIQDGTGNPMESTHDLVVTTTEQLTSEDIIVIEGKMTANKDFGAGYSYSAIIEEAILIK